MATRGIKGKYSLWLCDALLGFHLLSLLLEAFWGNSKCVLTFHRQCCKRTGLTSPVLFSLVEASTLQCQVLLLLQGSTVCQTGPGRSRGPMCVCAWFRGTQPAFGLTWPNPVLEPGLSGDVQATGGCWAWVSQSRG